MAHKSRDKSMFYDHSLGMVAIDPLAIFSDGKHSEIAVQEMLKISFPWSCSLFLYAIKCGLDFSPTPLLYKGKKSHNLKCLSINKRSEVLKWSIKYSFLDLLKRGHVYCEMGKTSIFLRCTQAAQISRVVSLFDLFSPRAALHSVPMFRKENSMFKLEI